MDVAIIGAGTIGKRLSRSFEECKDTEVRFVVDIEEKRAKVLADSIGAEYSTDYTEVMDQVDIVYVGVPPKYHSQITIDALEHGKHVICEKPISTSVEEGQEMVKVAEKVGTITTINLPFRFSPAFERMNNAIQKQEFGKFKHGELRFRFPKWPREWQNVEWLKYREQGGPLREVGTHYFFGLFELFKSVRRVLAFTTFENENQCENQSVGIIETGKGIVTLDLITGGKEEEENTLHLYFEEGALKFAKWYHLSLLPEGKVLVEDRVNAELQMIKAFVKAIKGDETAKRTLVSFQDALNAQLVLEGIYKSNGNWIEI